MAHKLSISLVVYHSDLLLLEKTLQSLKQAVGKALEAELLDDYSVKIVDNTAGKNRREVAKVLARTGMNGKLVTAPRNLGYGRGHNLALAHGYDDYHLVINPDVIVHEEAITGAIRYLQKHPKVGLITPLSQREEGGREYLCKAYPTVPVLLLRGFAPAVVKNRFSGRLDAYEQKDQDKTRNDVLIASGCFMFFRHEALRCVKGFSPLFFMYFEDFDLSLRLGKTWRIAYVPTVKIIHYGGNSAKKGFRHIAFFARSAITFFNLHGWRLW
ncbi:MAG: glycosyl transferase [Gammaproteobacteria bacterium HGW-Gammaproteobacteria-3]|nr:MAG: glycosyl transferase [Gammaproteobacteria bacterium HGW-Gammaproteobacteria-3]